MEEAEFFYLLVQLYAVVVVGVVTIACSLRHARRNIRCGHVFKVYMTCILLSVIMVVWHTSSPPQKGRHMEKVLEGVQEYGHGIRLGTWN